MVREGESATWSEKESESQLALHREDVEALAEEMEGT